MYLDDGETLFEQFDPYEDPDSLDEYAQEPLLSLWEDDLDELGPEDWEQLLGGTEF